MKKILIILILVLVPFFVFADTSTSFKNNETPLVRPSVEVVFDLNSDANSISYVGFTSSAPKWDENLKVPEESNVEFSLKLVPESNKGEGEGYVYWILRGNNGVTINISADENMKVDGAADSDTSKVLGWYPVIASKSENGSGLGGETSEPFDNTTGFEVHKREDLSKSLDYGYAKIAITTDSVADKAPENFKGTLTLKITKP